MSSVHQVRVNRNAACVGVELPRKPTTWSALTTMCSSSSSFQARKKRTNVGGHLLIGGMCIGSPSTLTESFLNRVICDSNRYGNSYRSLVWFLRHKLCSIVFFQHVTTTFFLMSVKSFFSSFLFYQRVNDKDWNGLSKTLV